MRSIVALVCCSVAVSALGIARSSDTNKNGAAKGVWRNISPSGVTMTAVNHVFCQGMAIDPRHPSTLYLCVCAYDVSKGGLYKSTDSGTTWNRIGILDEPIHISIDPRNSNHLYCVDGVRGATLGFWISNDGGATWELPQGFAKVADGVVKTRDLYSLAVDPTDFKHLLVSFHSPWNGTDNCGLLESKDSGASWTVHDPPAGSARGYGMAVFFLFNPSTHQGDKNTWLFTTQAGGFYKTADAGATWKQVYDKQMTHGGNQLYRTREGVLYSGGYQFPVRSTDNGETWRQIKAGLVYSWYMGICGDGTTLFTACSNSNEPFFTSSERDGETWTAFEGGAQKFSAEPFEMHYDAKSRTMYAASWSEGLLALKR